MLVLTSRIPVFLLLSLVLLGGSLIVADEDAGLDDQLAPLLEAASVEALIPIDAPSPEVFALGEALYWDPVLSGNKDIACASCHHAIFSSSDGLSLSLGTGATGVGLLRRRGVDRSLIPRNAPDIFNRGDAGWRTMFWDNRVSGSSYEDFLSPADDALPFGLSSGLAVQAMFPVTSPDEMRGAPGDLDVLGEVNELALIDKDDFPTIWAALMNRLFDIPEYRELFEHAYPDVEEFGFQHAANAIAAYEIDVFSFYDSPWDRYLAGDMGALSENAKRGALLFYGEAGCSSCHSGSLLTDQTQHNMAIPHVGPGKDEDGLDHGVFRLTDEPDDDFAFRTPPLRNVVLTGPWMHNGVYTTLEGAVQHMMNPPAALEAYDPRQLTESVWETVVNDADYQEAILMNLDPLAQTPVILSDAEFDDLMNFLYALTSPSALTLSSTIPDSVPSGLTVGGG